NWEIFLPWQDYRDRFLHGSKVKVHVINALGNHDRIPVYIRKTIQDETTRDFSGQLWFESDFKWTDDDFTPQISRRQPFIYECHVGMAQEKPGVGTYREFEENTLHRIKKAGYNTIQLMAVMEHPYYGSFGYYVYLFFATLMHFGSLQVLKSLVKRVQDIRIVVVMDLVHSHDDKHINEGYNLVDGTEFQYFHAGDRGNLSAW